eukprot:TRINITY_DN1920_c0_g1_i1.p1 TRINITY_DN1920_c0_g1~~TRINITY_DN1920_c0_g1_i1.p1  ORF type:complete len:282 (-),score=56.14 TRINITY_DN1920_c0_g1_i1:60-905(-)
MDYVVKNKGDVIIGAFVFLSIGCVFLIIAVVSFKILEKNALFQYFVIVSSHSNDDDNDYILANDIENQVSIEEFEMLNQDQLLIEYKRRAYITRQEIKDKTNNDDNNDEVLSTSQVFGKIIGPAICTWVLFAATTAGYPGEVLSIEHHGNPKILNWMGGDWWAIWLVLIFNVSDTIGRIIVGVVLFFNDKTMWIGVAVRWALVYCFYLCASNHWSDWWPLIFVTLFGMFNGYTSTCAMIFGPMKVSDANKEKAGFLLSLLLQVGIFTGAVFSIIVFQKSSS